MQQGCYSYYASVTGMLIDNFSCYKRVIRMLIDTGLISAITPMQNEKQRFSSLIGARQNSLYKHFYHVFC